MTGLQLSIRPAGPRDTADVLRLTEQMGGHEADARNPGAQAMYLATLQSPEVRALVAQVAGEVVGYIELRSHLSLFRGGREAWVSALMIDPGTRRRGVGRALLQAADEAASLLGCSALALVSSHWRSDAHALYRAMGFVEEAPAARFHRPVPGAGYGITGESTGHQFLKAAAQALSAVALALSESNHPAAGIGADGEHTTGPDWSAENAAVACLAGLGVPIISEESGVIGGACRSRESPG